MMVKQAGFTLLELVVALSIFAMIGAWAHGMLQSVLQARETTQVHSQQLTELQKAMWMMTQDVMQMEPGSAKVADGSYAVRFTRRGWRNPLSLPRSDRMCVAYGLNGTRLVRYYRPLAKKEGEAQTQVLLEDASGLQFQPMAHAMAFSFTSQRFGELRRVVEVAEP